MNKILLNNEEYKVTEQDLPYLVIYGEKSGGSHFTISLIAHLYSTGSKILFLTAYPMATENFLGQIGPDHSKVALVNSVEELEDNKDKQVIILESGNEKLFVEAVKNLPDIAERVILIKNIEVFSANVFDTCLNFNKLVLSGHIDTCISKENTLKKSYASMVVFTKPEIVIPVEVPELEKWTGYLSNASQKGMIKVQMS